VKTVEVKMMRDRTVSTTKGHTIRFTAGEPIHIPVVVLEDCLQAGAVPTAEEAGQEVSDNLPGVPVLAVAPTGGARDEQIIAAMKGMFARNGRDDFTGQGRPDVRVLSRELGFSVDARERDELWLQIEPDLKHGD
jgi:hypothetical protein